ncbi:MAG: FtsX-like permease family protein [Rhodospirillales bacterium]
MMFSRRTDLALEQDSHNRFLPWLIAFMVFLAILSAAGTFILGGMVARWDRNMSATLTVQLPTTDRAKQDEQNVARALKILRGTPGVFEARAVTADEMAGLLEPWLGRSKAISELPLPRLIDVELLPDSQVDIAALSQKLRSAVPSASIDDHRIWLDRFLRLIHMIQGVAVAILILIGAATVGTVIFTTRTGLAVHQEAVEVLHLIGAKDSYIARQFATRALLLALRGGLIGLALAVPALIAVSILSSTFDTGMIPKVSLAFDQWLILAVMPLIAALIAMLTARITVLQTLARML